MENDLAEYFHALSPCAKDLLHWPTGTVRLACYLTDKTPPLQYVTSARAVVTNGHQVLVVQEGGNPHILPGGRLELKETPEDAVQREVMEETGWSLACIRPIGILHVTFIDPKPEDYPYPYPDYPYPDFIQIVYAARPGAYYPDLKVVDGYEVGSEFVQVAEARQLPLDTGQQEFLTTAIKCIWKS